MFGGYTTQVYKGFIRAIGGQNGINQGFKGDLPVRVPVPKEIKKPKKPPEAKYLPHRKRY